MRIEKTALDAQNRCVYSLYKEKGCIGHAVTCADCFEALEIAPEWQSRGYGSYLLREVLRQNGGFDRTAPSEFTAPLPDAGNTAAQALAAKFGFVPRGGLLVRRRVPDLTAVELTHRFLRSTLAPGGLYLDATCGNGHDTLFLCSVAGENGRVIGLDIQPQAAANTNALLAANGTQLIIEMEDIDKYRNEQIHAGASKVCRIAKETGMDCRPLMWNPNYKGFDDWQLALKRKSESGDEKMNFKTRFLYGLCDFDAIDGEIADWHESPETESLEERLGFTNEEQSLFVKGDEETLLKMLLTQRRQQHFRIYQLRLDGNQPTVPFAFAGMEELHKAGYEQPPAAAYNQVYDGILLYMDGEDEKHRLKRIFERYNDDFPNDYPGRSIAPSDVIELYDDERRCYFYCEKGDFCPVRFSPMLAKQLKSNEE